MKLVFIKNRIRNSDPTWAIEDRRDLLNFLETANYLLNRCYLSMDETTRNYYLEYLKKLDGRS